MTRQSHVAVVSGASRGAGRGVAIALGRHGCTVYVTGRSARAGDHPQPGTIYETAEAVTAAGGNGIAVQVDHGEDEQVTALFDRVKADHGRLDILVNNAAAIYDELSARGPFWEKPLRLVDLMTVGLRSSYVATHMAMPLLIAGGKGLVAFTSSSGGVHYMMGPAYGVHKAGLDKMAADFAVDFKRAKVPVQAVSIWMGSVLTDRMRAIVAAQPEKLGHFLESGESPEFTGEVIWALYNAPDLAELNGQTVIGAEMAVKYGIEDEGGRRPPSIRDTLKVEPRMQPPVFIN
jgi:NAD(P)-dependent dehydrogenase (short-subunit alcohol dehydrogenase family)